MTTPQLAISQPSSLRPRFLTFERSARRRAKPVCPAIRRSISHLLMAQSRSRPTRFSCCSTERRLLRPSPPAPALPPSISSRRHNSCPIRLTPTHPPSPTAQAHGGQNTVDFTL